MSDGRICMIAYWFPPFYGGAGAQALRLAQRLAALGQPVDIVTVNHKGTALPQEVIDGVQVYRLAVRGKMMGRLRPFLFSLKALFFLLRRRRQYDIIHFHGAYLQLVPLLPPLHWLGKKTLIKMTLMDTDDPMTIRRRRSGRLLFPVIRMAGAVVAISGELAASYRQSGLPPERLARIPNGVDTEVFRPDTAVRQQMRRDLGIAFDAPVVLFVGEVGPRKGVDILLAAWESVQSQFPQAVLLLVGLPNKALEPYGRPFHQHVAQIAAVHPANIRALGQQPQIQRFYQMADIFVLPSRQEGLPNSTLEAMAVGLPIVASRIGGNIDLLRDNENGLLVPAADEQALAEALRHFLSDPAFARQLGDAARQTAVTHYALPVVAQKYLKLYRDLRETN